MPDFMEETAECNMKIAVLSGKGGTGKTLVSVNLAAVAGHSTYIDCDVEEPNGHLFFKPAIAREELITVKIRKSMKSNASAAGHVFIFATTMP